MAVIMMMFMFVAAIFRIAFRQIVVMKMKKPLQKKHGEEPAQHPVHRASQRMQLLRRVRQKMQQGDAEHEARDKADGHLQTGVGQVDEERQPAARQRGEQYEQAIKNQQPRGRNHGLVIINSPHVCQPERSGGRKVGGFFESEACQDAFKVRASAHSRGGVKNKRHGLRGVCFSKCPINYHAISSVSQSPR